MSPNSEIQVEDLCSEKKYFSQIPNIIHKMGLGPYVVAYYCLLKSIAGDRNTCFMSQKNIASTLRCSTRQVGLMNKFMSKPFEILGNKPLIKITQQIEENGLNKPNLIQVVDIWIENIQVLNNKNPVPHSSMPPQKKNIKKNNTPASDAGGHASDAGGHASGADKEEPINNNPVIKMYFKDLGLKTEALDKSNGENLDVAIRWKLSEDQKDIFMWLKSLSIDAEDKKLAFWAKKYSLKRLTEVYHEAKSYKPRSMRMYMSKLLDNNKAVPNANAEMNREFADDFFKANEIKNVTTYKKYLKIPNGMDFIEINFDMNCNDFIITLMEKFESLKKK